MQLEWIIVYIVTLFYILWITQEIRLHSDSSDKI